MLLTGDSKTVTSFSVTLPFPLGMVLDQTWRHISERTQFRWFILYLYYQKHTHHKIFDSYLFIFVEIRLKLTALNISENKYHFTNHRDRSGLWEAFSFGKYIYCPAQIPAILSNVILTNYSTPKTHRFFLDKVEEKQIEFYKVVVAHRIVWQWNIGT